VTIERWISFVAIALCPVALFVEGSSAAALLASLACFMRVADMDRRSKR